MRRSLLDCAARIAECKGAAALTLNAVSAAAGVSKGALQHHYVNKQALLDALFADLHAKFMDEIRAEFESDPVSQGRATRAYMRVLARQAAPGQETGLLRALTALMLTDADMRSSWSTMVNKDLEESYQSEGERLRLQICRLAIDGLWMSDLLGYNRMTAEAREHMLERLEAMTYDGLDDAEVTRLTPETEGKTTGHRVSR